MDQWAVVLPAPAPEAFLPSTPPRRRRARATTFALLGVVLLLGAGVLVRGRGPTLAAADRPGAARLPLGVRWTVRDPAAGSVYEIRFPNEPRTSHDEVQALETFAMLATVKIDNGVYLLLGRYGEEVPRDARAALATMEQRIGGNSILAADGPIRTTRVGNGVAYAQDFTVGVNGNRLTEYRFQHRHRVYTAAILVWPSASGQGRNTALASLQSLRWTA